MQIIKGKYRSSIFESNSGYKVGLFKVKEACDELLDIVNKTITFSGYFNDLNDNDTYELQGEYVNHPKYGYQFQTSSYSRVDPIGKDAVIEFLSSDVIHGCGEKTAMSIVNTLGEHAIEKIKENANCLLMVPKMTSKRALEIYNSIMEYSQGDEIIIELKKLGFSIREALKLYKSFGSSILNIVHDDIYSLIKYTEFALLDEIFLKSNDINDPRRVRACIIESMKKLTFNDGDTYSFYQEIYLYMKSYYHINIEEIDYEQNLVFLKNDSKIVIEEDRYYLKDYYDEEEYIANALNDINNLEKPVVKRFNENLNDVQCEISVKYNDEQLKAIKCALENNISIITGGPGTGKTTIVNGIVKMYQKTYDLYKENDIDKIVLLAPTGRAAKRMCETTNFPACTIHRYLKWNKEDNSFGYNEFNVHTPSIIIIDETSMVDTFLLCSLLKGIRHSTQIVFVGDENQLPSVGPGLTLTDLINTNCFNHVSLKQIYRQSDNSYIPFLAREIKNGELSDEFNKPKDDFRYIKASGHQIKGLIKELCELSIKKGLKETDLEILAPMYKGENGIDNLNMLLQSIFNPENSIKKQVQIGDIIYRENDKVIELVNDPDNNVYNGDIGYIVKVNLKDPKSIVEVNFDGNFVVFKKEDLINIKHAYAISVHKSQGSEFNHVIMPITESYSRMLYNRLIYTGITRAKKSLIIIGNNEALIGGINNKYSMLRKTTLMSKITYRINNNNNNN